MYHPWKVLAAALFIIAVFYGNSPVSAQTPEVYDFESLSIHSFIDGHDNWVDKPGQGDGVIYLDDTGNDTKVARPLPTVAFDEDVYLARANDSAFGFPAFNSSATDAVIRFELNGEHLALFGLGHDLDGDGVLEEDPYSNGSGGELGPVFGDYDRNFTLREANFGASTSTPFGSGNSGNDWYRMELRIDFTANGGEGAGSLFYLNITDGDTEFQAVSGLQGINLQLGRLHPDAGPETWDTMWLQLRASGSNRAAVDNLVPNTSPVPGETVSVALDCSPSSGTVPFQSLITLTLDNLYQGQRRRIAGRIDVTLAGGAWFPGWRAGYTNVAAGESFASTFGLTIPALGSVIGDNHFLLLAEDVTPAPYNQPPYPPAGDTASDSCTVTGIAP